MWIKLEIAVSVQSCFGVVVYWPTATLSANLIVDIPNETTKYIKSNYTAKMGLSSASVL